MRTVGLGAVKKTGDTKFEELREEIKKLKKENAALKKEIAELDKENATLHEENVALKSQTADAAEPNGKVEKNP